MSPERVNSATTTLFSKTPRASKEVAFSAPSPLGRLRKLGQALREHTAVLLLVAFVIIGAFSSDVFLTPR